MRMVMESPCIAVTVNGKVIEVPEGTTLADLLGSEGYDRSRIAVEVDGDICPRADLGSHVIRGGETVEVVSFVGGGRWAAARA